MPWHPSFGVSGWRFRTGKVAARRRQRGGNKSNRNIRVKPWIRKQKKLSFGIVFCSNRWTKTRCLIRYLAPEYAQSGQITEKADVYSFGVVLVELVTGRKAVDINRPKGQQCLTEWVRIRDTANYRIHKMSHFHKFILNCSLQVVAQTYVD